MVQQRGYSDSECGAHTQEKWNCFGDGGMCMGPVEVGRKLALTRTVRATVNIAGKSEGHRSCVWTY